MKLFKYYSYLIFLLFLLTPFFIFSENISAITVTMIPTQSANPSISSTKVPSPRPTGQTIRLDLRIPGIGSEGGNMVPLRPVREASIYFFEPDVNTEIKSVKPISHFKTTVTYDQDPASGTFGNFVNDEIFLDKSVEDGRYQIVIKINQNLAKLIKDEPTSIGGRLFDVKKSNNGQLIISGQELILGDIYPSPFGDNIMDINDYNGLVSCFGQKADTQTCIDKLSADLDDNGFIDGTDYNLMFGSFKKLLDAGYPVPSFLTPSKKPTPTPVISKKPTGIPTKTANAELNESSSDRSGLLAGVGVVILLVLFVILIIILKKKKKLTFLEKLIHKNESTEQIDATTTEGTEASEQEIDKEYYIKQQAFDDVNQVQVLTLTDDSGPTLGYYKGEEIKEGFAHVKGSQKKEGEKVYIDISEIKPTDTG